MKYPFSYKVVFYDEGKYQTECGMGICESFADAANTIEKFYGNTLISVKNLELLEDAPVILMHEQVCREVVESINGCDGFAVECDNKGVPYDKKVL